MKALAQVIETLSLEMDFHKACQSATRIAMEIVGGDVSALALPTGAGAMCFQYFWGLPADADVADLSQPLEPNAATTQAFRSGKPAYVADYPNYEHATPPLLKLGIKAGLAVPVMVGTQPVGAFSIGWLHPAETAPTPDQEETLGVIARQVGIAYHRMNLMRELSHSQMLATGLNQRLNRIMAVSPAIIYSVTLDMAGPKPELQNLLLGENVRTVLGCSRENLMQQPNQWYQLVHPDDLPAITLANNPQALVQGHFERTYRMRHDAGHYVWVEENMRLFPAGERLYELVGVVMDISARKASEIELQRHRDHLQELVTEQTESLRNAKNVAEQAMREAQQTGERLRRLAHNDTLTGLANRALMTELLEQAIAYAERQNLKLALLFIDLDRFKNINDSLGHSLGDRLLQQVAVRLRDHVRHADTIGRLGGDEFIVLLSAIDHAEAVAGIAESLIAAIAKPYLIDGHELAVTLSMGISFYPDDGKTPEDLIKKADTAMYKAKEAGRNTYQFFTQHMGDMARDRLTLENELRRALERQELELHYQPQADVITGAVIGVEALLRWRHPERGLLLPRDFISVAEESGLIVPLGNWALREACRQNRTWQAAGLPPIPVAVNISPLQFRRLGLLQEIETVLEKTGLAPCHLILELTETVVMHHVKVTVAMLDALKTMGVRISIDDFGAGYSSLGYLKSFPLDWLKIDRSFITDLTRNSSDAAIVRAIIGMGHSLGLKVIAEGVSSDQHLAHLRQLGCDQFQGNHYSPPLEADAFARLLALKGVTVTASGNQVRLVI